MKDGSSFLAIINKIKLNCCRKIRVHKDQFVNIVAILFVLSLIGVMSNMGSYVHAEPEPEFGILGNEHIHASILVKTHGDKFDFLQPAFQIKSSWIHFEGQDGGTIHRHSTGVTLGYLFETLGITVNDECYTLPINEIFCTNNDSSLKFYINHNQVSDIRGYVIQDGDRILISYGNETFKEIEKQLAELDSQIIETKQETISQEPTIYTESIKPGSISVYKYYSNKTTILIFKPNQKLDIQTFEFQTAGNKIKAIFGNQNYWEGYKLLDEIFEYRKTPQGYGLYSYVFGVITDEPNPVINWRVLSKDKILTKGDTDNIPEITESNQFYQTAYDFAYNIPDFVDFSKPPEYYIEQYHANPQFYQWYSQRYPYHPINEAVGISKEKYKQILDDLETELNTGPKICVEGTGFQAGYCIPERLAKCEARLENGLCVNLSESYKYRSDSTAKFSYKTGLQKGQWVKYQLSNFDVNSNVPFMSSESLQQAFLESIIPVDDVGSYLNTKWFKLRIDNISGSKVTMITSLGLSDGGEKDVVTQTLDVNDAMLVIPTNMKIGDKITWEDNEFIVKDEVQMTIGGKQVDALRLVSEQVLSDLGVISEVRLENFYHKQTGMLLLINNEGHVRGGGQSIDFTIALNAVEVSDHFLERASPSLVGGGCLIATATFGTELAPQVQLLREIRDNKVLKTESGFAFMAWFNDFYYSFSPTVADWERQNPIFKEAVKVVITPMITSLSILNYVDVDSEEGVLRYGIGIFLLNVGIYFIGPSALILKIRKIFQNSPKIS